MDLLVIPVPFIASAITSFKCPTRKDSGNLVKATPPGYVFGVMWSLLYLAIGYSWYLTRQDDPNTLIGLKVSDILFIINLVAINSWLYFYNCEGDKRAALYTFLVAITTTIMLISYSSMYIRNGSWWQYMLLIPYLVWLLFAQQLNFHDLEKSVVNPVV